MTDQEMLDQARAALHQLMTGRRSVSVAYDGESVTYTPASEGSLRKWIAELEARLGLRRHARRPGVSA